MHDHVASVDQNPIALRQAFDAHARQAPVLQLARQILGQRRDMPRRPPRGDDDGVAQRRPAAEVDLDDVFRLVVVEGGEDACEKGRFGSRCFLIATQLYAGRAAQGSAPSRGWSRGSALRRAKTGIRGVSQSVPQLSRSFNYGYSPQQEQYHNRVSFARRKRRATACRSRDCVSLL